MNNKGENNVNNNVSSKGSNEETLSEDNLDSLIKRDTLAIPRPVHLFLSESSGDCLVTLPSRWVDISHPLECVIEFYDFKVPIVSCQLMLIRAEYMQAVPNELLILMHEVRVREGNC